MPGTLRTGAVTIIDFGKSSATISSASSFPFLLKQPGFQLPVGCLVLSCGSWVSWFSFSLFAFQFEPFGGVFISVAVFPISTIFILFFLVVCMALLSKASAEITHACKAPTCFLSLKACRPNRHPHLNHHRLMSSFLVSPKCGLMQDTLFCHWLMGSTFRTVKFVPTLVCGNSFFYLTRRVPSHKYLSIYLPALYFTDM